MTNELSVADETRKQSIIVRRARSYYIGALRSLIIFLIICWAIVIYQRWFCAGIGLLLFMIAGIRNSINNLNDLTVQIEVNRSGIRFKDQALLPWVQIRDVWLSQHKVTMIVLELEDGHRVQHVLDGLDMTPGELVRVVKDELMRASPLYAIYREGVLNRLLRKYQTKNQRST